VVRGEAVKFRLEIDANEWRIVFCAETDREKKLLSTMHGGDVQQSMTWRLGHDSASGFHSFNSDYDQLTVTARRAEVDTTR